ncbi:MAG: hypothetical protein ACIARR_11550 [Phycisphaerales bacterium JB059]
MNDPSPPPVSQAPPTAPDRVRCASCHYDITDQPIGGRCPECGTPINQRVTVTQSQGKAITALVLGICSIPGCFMYGVPGIICGVLAIIFAKQARIAIQEGRAPITSAGMAKGGQVCGIVGLCLSVVYFLFMAAMIALTIVTSP